MLQPLGQRAKDEEPLGRSTTRAPPCRGCRARLWRSRSRWQGISDSRGRLTALRRSVPATLLPAQRSPRHHWSVLPGTYQPCIGKPSRIASSRDLTTAPKAELRVLANVFADHVRTRQKQTYEGWTGGRFLTRCGHKPSRNPAVQRLSRRGRDVLFFGPESPEGQAAPRLESERFRSATRTCAGCPVVG
jgi:hypothetical protein